MKYYDLISLSTRGFKTNTSRTALTILGLGVGIGAVLFLVSLGYGLQNIILNKITTADSLLTLDVSAPSNLVELNKSTVEIIKNIPGVIETSPILDLAGQVAYDNETTDGIIYLVDKSYFRLSGSTLMSGQEFSGNEVKEAIVSSASAKLFGFAKPEDMIGQTIKINLFIPETGKEDVSIVNLDDDYKISGLVSDDNTSFIYIPIATISIPNLPPYSNLKVRVQNEVQLNTVRDNIVKQGFLVSSISDTIEQTKKIFSIIQLVLGAFGLLALIVSAIGMFNTMTITLLERTKEIGIMRAVGMSNGDVARLFLMESVVMGFLGGIGGVLIGLLSGKVFNLFINLLAKNFGGQNLDLFYCPTWFYLSVIGFSILTGFITGVYPARRAAKLNPLDALRYK